MLRANGLKRKNGTTTTKRSLVERAHKESLRKTVPKFTTESAANNSSTGRTDDASLVRKGLEQLEEFMNSSLNPATVTEYKVRIELS